MIPGAQKGIHLAATKSPLATSCDIFQFSQLAYGYDFSDICSDPFCNPTLSGVQKLFSAEASRTSMQSGGSLEGQRKMAGWSTDDLRKMSTI